MNPHYLSEDTICAISSQTGGAISIVRVSGPSTFASLAKLTRSQESLKCEPRKLVRSPLYLENGNPFDDALFVRFVAPLSYTGEDMVEFHIHGGSFIAQLLMETLATHKIRQALPGEFSFRAVRNGKMTLFQAQAVADLIQASNEGAISLALEKASQSQANWIKRLADQLREIATLGELGIDFSDQDIDEVSLPRLKTRLEAIENLLVKLSSSYTRGVCVQEGLKVAFVGLPNAGKSTLFNSFLGQDRSIVSEWAGTTRDVVQEKLTLRTKTKSLTLRVSDTAGLRTTDEPIEKMGIERTLNSVREADVVLFIVDASSSQKSTCEKVLEQWEKIKRRVKYPEQLQERTLGVLTKSDLASSEAISGWREFGTQLGISNWITTSAVSDQGISEGIQTLIEFCEKWTRREPEEILLTRLDHFDAVNQALEHIRRAKSVPEQDLFASDIRQSLFSLTPLIGETLPDDILGKIFSEFCIGK